ncbi:SMP-30/gluconolactonase/LRE family protein [Nocardia flavorosea]|uniref:SMP-30/gluconolactonase/LRE family protein n=1 Tax=Nocardia flavorosea TaxID=53429 RepID=UPI001892EBE2|nr:SMP-30/gluconolactonase/LRE family protein [Nocardia flavorosea]MBF6351716.1 SMP-30/gluconolactonase/LRE family protein [Nocardia flavorosea]
MTSGLHFAESPATGPDGQLYVSDFYAHELLQVDPRSFAVTVAARVPGQPSGMGWLPDGTHLVVSMRDKRVLAVGADGSTQCYADLGRLARGAANDMFVDSAGRAWVGTFGFDFYAELAAHPEADPLFGPEANPPTAEIIAVTGAGRAGIAATGLRFPNGTAQLTDGTLVVAETAGACLTGFTIAGNAALTQRRTVIDLSSAGVGGEPIRPDGICVDAEDGVWVSDPAGGRVVRFDVTRGVATDAVATSQPCFAVGFTGAGAQTLVCCTAQTSNPNIAARERTGRLETVRVAVPGRQA